MPGITTRFGAAAFVLGWLLLVVALVSQVGCLQLDSCRSSDFVVAILAGAGLLVPSYFFGAFISTAFR